MANFHQYLFVFLFLCFVSVFQANAGLTRKHAMTMKGMKCTPGHTEIFFSPPTGGGEALRSHMNSPDKSETCKMCTCSVDGDDIHCWRRPAMNMNECLFLSKIKTKGALALSWNEDKLADLSLSNRIRRDYVFHKDELGYDPLMHCRRGNSYYTNKDNGTADVIDFESDSLLDYPNTSICWYCICEATGFTPVCMEKDPWVCQYYRNLRDPIEPVERYAHVFHRDVPGYFRDISWRTRRLMDDSLYEILDSEGVALCCNQNRGNVANLHRVVRQRVRKMHRRNHKENLMAGAVAEDYKDFIVNND